MKVTTIKGFMLALEVIVQSGGGDQEVYALVVPQNSIDALSEILNNAQDAEKTGADGEGRPKILTVSNESGDISASLVSVEYIPSYHSAAQGETLQ